jgi:16S rRNA (cytosine1402-N4)-methyltransferase
MAIISFHSLEDKIVKDFFSSLIIDKTPKELPIVKKSDFVLTNKKPILGDEEENKRARSAKLRGVKKNV